MILFGTVWVTLILLGTMWYSLVSTKVIGSVAPDDDGSGSADGVLGDRATQRQQIVVITFLAVEILVRSLTVPEALRWTVLANDQPSCCCQLHLRWPMTLTSFGATSKNHATCNR